MVTSAVDTFAISAVRDHKTYNSGLRKNGLGFSSAMPLDGLFRELNQLINGLYYFVESLGSVVFINLLSPLENNKNSGTSIMVINILKVRVRDPILLILACRGGVSPEGKTALVKFATGPGRLEGLIQIFSMR